MAHEEEKYCELRKMTVTIQEAKGQINVGKSRVATHATACANMEEMCISSGCEFAGGNKTFI